MNQQPAAKLRAHLRPLRLAGEKHQRAETLLANTAVNPETRRKKHQEHENKKQP